MNLVLLSGLFVLSFILLELWIDYFTGCGFTENSAACMKKMANGTK